MKCPNCNVNLLMSNRSGVEIDYCPECRGIWLDRGELDKLLEREQSSYAPSTQPKSINPDVLLDKRKRDDDYFDEYRKRDDDYRYGDDDYGHYDKRHKKKGFLGEIFDIFD